MKAKLPKILLFLNWFVRD